VVELKWQAATLIEPFLEDVRNLIISELPTDLSPQGIDKLVKTIYNRFSDWQVGMAIVLTTGQNKFRVFGYGGFQAYVLDQGKPVKIPTQDGVVVFEYLFKPAHPLIVVNQLLPTQIKVEDMTSFIQTLTDSGRGFVIIKPPLKQPPINKLKQLIPRRYLLLGLVLIGLVLGGLVLGWWLSRGQKAAPPPASPAVVELKTSLDEVMVMVESDPTEALRRLEKIKQKVNFYQIDDPTLRSTIDQIEGQLSGVGGEGLSLVFNGQRLSGVKLAVDQEGPLAVSGTSIYRLKLNEAGVTLELLSQASEPVVEVTPVGPRLIILTTKGIFQLETDQRLTQLADLPDTQVPEHLGAYLNNLYLLTRSGSVYKYPQILVRYPQKPRLYFADPKLEQAKRMVVRKYFYLLTQSGQVTRYYFGRSQNFKLDSQVGVINDLYYHPESGLFYFLTPTGWGVFTPDGRVVDNVSQENNHQQLVVWQDKILLLQNDRLFITDLP